MAVKRWNQTQGQRGESLAAAYLEAQGYQILQRNYRCPLGELDLVAREGEYLVFVEVKCRTSWRFGHPAEAVGYSKRKRLERLGSYFLRQYRMENQPCRFDVVAVLLSRGEASVELFRNAFGVNEGW